MRVGWPLRFEVRSFGASQRYPPLLMADWPRLTRLAYVLGYGGFLLLPPLPVSSALGGAFDVERTLIAGARDLHIAESNYF